MSPTAVFLDQWQERLERHFAELAATRAYSDFPLFALEHGLSHQEVNEISQLVHARLREGARLARHWLVWVVYAAELGYDYDGDEYWYSFESRTPHWRESVTSTRRNLLRDWFVKFQAAYNGVKPSGLWAEFFSIIAWPITHAILPKYLQWQFAKTLYELRYQLAHLDDVSAGAVGELLSANAWEASSRFREFLQQQELAGRIVIALLGEKPIQSQSPIFTPTLHRLVSDLEEVQSTREWLKETRRMVAERLKGSARAPIGTAIQRVGAPPADNGAARTFLSLRPSLMLRRSTASTWSAVLDIPSFSGIARSQTETQAFLRTTRCRITGTGDTWLPGGWLLSGSRRRVVKTWPGAGAPLVIFERPHPLLDQLIGSDSRLPSGPVWPCRIGNDGLAREVLGRAVRPGRKYILLSEAEIPLRASFLTPCQVDCSGIHAATLSVPETISSELTSRLSQWGLSVARTVRIWPVGLSARDFDGEGHSEWLTTEAPCFGITHDHAVDAYGLRLDNEAEIVIKAAGANSPVFVKIGKLSQGRHTLLVKARRAYQSGIPTGPASDGIVTLDVREPQPWVPGTTSHAGLVISLEPHDPTLDAFWEGDVAVSVIGPAGHQVTCAIVLRAANGKELLTEQIGTFDLPITTADWFKKFFPFVKNERRAWIYLEATSGSFVVKGEELGEYTRRLERDVKPLRFVCRNIQRATTLRLIDDTGGDNAPTCTFFSLRRPAIPIVLDNDSLMTGYQVPAPGGVFQARHGKFEDAVTVSIPPGGHGFADLIVEPDPLELQGEKMDLTCILEALRLWSVARMLGPLVAIRRDRIVGRLINAVYAHLCGRRWAEAEAAFLGNPHSGPEKRALEQVVGGSPAFPLALGREHDRMNDLVVGVQWFAGVASRYQVSSDSGLCEFALQLASRPHDLLLSPIPKQVLGELLFDIKDKVILMRGARLVALLAGRADSGFFGGAFPRWKWQ
jgi:hypothetical protein